MQTHRQAPDHSQPEHEDDHGYFRVYNTTVSKREAAYALRNVFRHIDAAPPVARPAPKADLRTRQVTMGAGQYDAHGASVPIPFLRLRGKWLERGGFPIRVNLRITVEMGRLVIEPAPPELVTETVIVGTRKRVIE